MEADSLKADNKKIWIRGQFVEVTDEVVLSGIGFCRCKEPFIYQSCGETGEVKYVFMLAIPGTQSGEQYMGVLATLATLLAKEKFVDHLDEVGSYEELMDLVKICSEE